ncbi:tetratricopeptide repeat protein 29-like [Amphiura filiformis]|uniref:tetratricopeptide repeat protein 29-like n=1 Tax=Amphiura filiformis TaxID=82378 RepID=UPI003B227F39
MAAPLPAIRNMSGHNQGHSQTVMQHRVPSPPNKNRPAGQYVKPTLKTRKESRFSMKQQQMRIKQPELSSLDTQRFRNTYFHNLCLEMLKDGFHRSFSEIFALVKEQQNEIEDAGTDSLIQDRTLLADMHSKLDAMKAHLTQGELALRAGNMEGVYEPRQALAKYFLETDDLRLSDHFFNSCLDTALQIQGGPGKRKEAEAHCNLGLAYERRREFNLATQHFEAFYKLTSGKTGEWVTAEGQTLYSTACEHLRRLYTTIAQSSHVDDHAAQQEAITYLQKAFEMAKASGDEHKEGDSSYRLGLAYEHSGDCETALMYHTRFMDVCKKIGDQEGMGSACEAIAKCYEKQGQLDEAVRYLEMFVDLAGGSKQEKAQGRASTCLGAIFNSLGQYEKASHHFGKAYNIARSMGDSASLEESRVQFGIASAHKALSNFVSLLENPSTKETSNLVDWKDLRKPLTDEGGQKV